MSAEATLLPLGDQALLAYFADEPAALRFAAAVRRERPPWLIDVVPAYASVAVFFDADRSDCATAADYLRALASRTDHSMQPGEPRRHAIPCCYEMGQDLGRVAGQAGLATDEVIRLHTGTEFVVYAIGFCPGFPYLGYLPPALCGMPRLASPRVRVDAGSVGLTGRQTGIYTLPRPGGWNLVGRTPLTLVDVQAGYFPLRAGDRVQFARIDEAEYRRLEGQRL
jgi:inhibitor of KinA